MLFPFLVSILTTIIIVFYYPKRSSKLWLIIFIISGIIISSRLLPWEQHFDLRNLGLICLLYSSVVFSLLHSDLFSAKKNQFISVVAGITLLLILGASFFYVYTSSLITYFILAIVIVIHLIGIKRERRRVVLSFRIKTIRYFTPVMIGFLVISNLTRMESVGGELVSIVMIIITAIALFDGSLGIRLHPEINSLIGTRKTMTTGVSIINHTIKNEMAKIQFLISKIEEELEQTKNQLLKKWIVSIRESSIHLTQINKRIKRLTHDIRLSRELTKLSTVVRSIYDESITINQAKANPVKISLFVETDFVMQLDRLHLKEALKNIIINSQESFKDIKRQPKIRISLKEVNGRAVLSIADNGKGIPHKMLSNIREPFFTSKKGGANFGLGLSYCQNIFDLHGIKMKIKSIEGRGTVVSLIFKKKLIRTKSK